MPRAAGRLGGHHHHRARAVGDLRGGARRDRAVGAERRGQLAERPGCRVRPDTLVGVEPDRLPAPLRDSYRHDLVHEQPILDRRGGALVRPGRELVLLGPADAQAGIMGVGELAHRGMVERIGQAVECHCVGQLDGAEFVPGAGARQQVRGPRHRLHAAGHHDLELARPDQLRGQRDRVQAGQAHLVDGDRGHGHRDAGRHRGLPRRDLARPGLQHLAHDHVLRVGAGEAAAFQRRLDDDAAQVGGGEVLQRAEQAAEGRAGTTRDHRFWHGPSAGSPAPR